MRKSGGRGGQGTSSKEKKNFNLGIKISQKEMRRSLHAKEEGHARLTDAQKRHPAGERAGEELSMRPSKRAKGRKSSGERRSKPRGEGKKDAGVPRGRFPAKESKIQDDSCVRSRSNGRVESPAKKYHRGKKKRGGGDSAKDEGISKRGLK